MSTVNTSLYETSVQNTKNITVTIPIKQKYQSLIAPAIGTNGNNIKSVKQRIISGFDPKFFYIYIKGNDNAKYWHLTVSITDPLKWKLLEKAQIHLDKHLDFFYKKKINYNAALTIQKAYRKTLEKKSF
jgi:hypothetical protein